MATVPDRRCWICLQPLTTEPPSQECCTPCTAALRARTPPFDPNRCWACQTPTSWLERLRRIARGFGRQRRDGTRAYDDGGVLCPSHQLSLDLANKTRRRGGQRRRRPQPGVREMWLSSAASAYQDLLEKREGRGRPRQEDLARAMRFDHVETFIDHRRGNGFETYDDLVTALAGIAEIT